MHLHHPTTSTASVAESFVLVHGKNFHHGGSRRQSAEKPGDTKEKKVYDIERAIEDDFATIRETYGMLHPLTLHFKCTN